MRQIALLLLTIAVAQASVTVTRTSNDGRQPSSMELEVQLPYSNKKVRIPLTRTDGFDNIPMTLVENGVSRTFSSRQVHHVSHSHYRNIDSKSVISVREANGKRQISGHVMHEGTSYFLEPIGDSEHRVTKSVRNPKPMEKQVDLGKLNVQSRRKRQTNTSPTTNTVEIHLLLDSTVWSAFKTLYGTDSVALTELNYYYTHILNGIDTVYRNIKLFSIGVECIGITISKTASDDGWMPEGSQDDSTTQGGEALDAMTSYSFTSGKSADHFMAFTRKAMRDGSVGIAGVAFTNTICQSNSMSICFDNGLHSWLTAAHELGHNLGADQHDGEGNNCSEEKKNLLSPSTNSYSERDVANSYIFSSCSTAAILSHINWLGPSSCLLSRQGSRLPQLTSNEREGARMTLNQVCRLKDNSLTLYYTDYQVSNPASICARIYCKSPNGDFSRDGELRAPVGTPCGSRKSCDWSGRCTPDKFAPIVDKSCFWGDVWANGRCRD